MKRFAFFGFSHSDVAARPWLEAGVEVVMADIQHLPGWHSEGGGLHRLGCDMSKSEALLDWLSGIGRCVFAGFFPPCTHIAVSGARWWKSKGLRALQESVGFFATSQEVAESLGAPYFIENPVSAMSTHWRKPDYSFNPFEYTALAAGDNYTKKTCLWTGNGFKMPPAMRSDACGAPDNRIHKAPDSKGRAATRSLTPEGFARAVYLANK